MTVLMGRRKCDQKKAEKNIVLMGRQGEDNVASRRQRKMTVDGTIQTRLCGQNKQEKMTVDGTIQRRQGGQKKAEKNDC